MLELLEVKGMGVSGLATDLQPWTLPPEYITHGRNFRIFAGALRAAGGSKLWSTAPVSFNPGFVIHVGVTSGEYWLVCGRDAVYAFDGTTWSDVSSAIGYAGLGPDDELRWTGCFLGAIPIINNVQANPEFWSPQSPGQVLQPLPFDAGNTWAEKGFSFNVIRSHRNFLFAMDLQEGNQELFDSYRFSTAADINGLPVTWDETDQSFLAGKASLGADSGKIIDGFSLRDAFCMYSENAINILDYTGDEFVFRRRTLSSTVGLLSRNSIVEVKGRHFFLADGDIVVNDGTSIQSIAHDRIRRQLTARINVDNYQRSYAVRNDSLKEIWFCVVEEDATYPNVAYIYNWRDDSWAIRDLPENTAFANYGSQSDPAKNWNDFDDVELWETQKIRWGAATLTPLDDTIVGVNSVDSSLTFLDPQETPETDINTVIERTDFPLVNERQVTSISRVYLSIEGTEPLEVQFGSQDYPGSPVRWKPIVAFDPRTDRKIDVRTTGELHCWRFTSVGKGTWSMSGMSIEFARSGIR